MEQQWEYSILYEDSFGIDIEPLMHKYVVSLCCIATDGKFHWQDLPDGGKLTLHFRPFNFLLGLLGGHSWELVTVNHAGNTTTAYLKRPATGKPLLLDANKLGVLAGKP